MSNKFFKYIYDKNPLSKIKCSIILITIIFSLGLLFVLTNKQKPLIESFSLNNECPNILIQKGKHIHLYNSKCEKGNSLLKPSETAVFKFG